MTIYVDGVFAGGGVKAIAMLGALEETEKRGIRFKRAVGTSAGAIVAAFTVAGLKSRDMLKMVETVDLSSFLDERKSLLPGFLMKWIQLYWRLGLYKGDCLEQWIGDVLAQRGIVTFGDMPKGSLKVVASDLTRGRLIVLPDDLKDYGLHADSFPVAKAIRMSCSLPYFYEPIKLYNGAGQKSFIVDGGVLSNFPMWLFENEGDGMLPVRPVLGIQLSSRLEESRPNKINNAIQLYQALFETMKEAHDARYISKKHVKNIIFLPVDHFETTNFHLTEEKKKDLLELGRKRAAHFFKNWIY